MQRNLFLKATFLVSIVLPFFTFQHSQAEIKAIVCDLGYFLLKPHRMTIARKIGLREFISYFFSGNNPKKIQSLMYEVLKAADESPLVVKVFDNEGNELPKIFIDWQKGFCTAQEVKDKAKTALKKLKDQGFFKNKREYKLVKKTIETTIHPENLAESMRVCKDGLKLIKKLKKVKNSDGSPKYSFYILSNWDQQSFDLVIQNPELQELFEHFELKNIMISGDHGLAKPDPRIFEYFLNLYNLYPDECMFFDDQFENIESAQELGIHTVHWQGNYKEVKKKLKVRDIF